MNSMKKNRWLLSAGVMLAALTAAPGLMAQEPVKVAGIHASPVESAWNSRLHEVMLEAAADRSIE